MKTWGAILIVFVVLLSCQSADSVKPVRGQGLPGTWLLYETGYSPGSGYIINKVAAQPAQTLTFTNDGHFQAQGDKLRQYQSFTMYRLDTVKSWVQLHYLPLADSSFTYEIMRVRNDTLTLAYPYCIEGCHSAFVRIK